MSKFHRTLKYITTTPNIMGGKPVIKGTRIPITRIAYLLLKENYTLEMVHDEYPHVNMKVLEGVRDEIMNLIDHPIYA